MAKYRKDVDVLVRKARAAGWRWEQKSDQHPILYPPTKDLPAVPVPISLSDHRGLLNFRSRLRKSGLDC